MQSQELSIRYSGIPINSEEQFDFQIGDLFFHDYPDSPVKHGLIDVNVIVFRQLRMVNVNISFHGVIELACDRCLENFGLPIEGKERLIVKFGSETEDSSDDLLIVPEDQGSIDLRHQLYELISLQIPLKRVHPGPEDGSGCSPEFLELLKKHAPKHIPVEDPSDPRWNALRGLMNGN